MSSKLTNDVVTCHKQLRALLLETMGFDAEEEESHALAEHICQIDLHDGACYIPGKGFQGVRVSLDLAQAHRVMDIYERHAQPVMEMVSVFSPAEKLTDEEIDQVRSNALQNKACVMRMTQRLLVNKNSDVAQFLAHYGKLCNTRDIYKRSKDGKHRGALCIWSAPDVSQADAADMRVTLDQISDLNGRAADARGVDGDGSTDMCDVNEEYEAYGEEAGGPLQGKGGYMRTSEDEVLYRDLVSKFNGDMQKLRSKADDFNRSYAHTLCDELKIPAGSINDDPKWRKLFTKTACTLSNITIEGERIVASMKENRCKEGKAVVFHSPESGSTMYDMRPDARNAVCLSSSLGRHDACAVKKAKEMALSASQAHAAEAKPPSREVMPHGIQIPPAIDGISSNRYATNEDVDSYAEEMIHRTAWAEADESHHLSSEFYLSGAPHPVNKRGIMDEEGLRHFLDNLVIDAHHESDESVYVPDKNQVVCDIVRKAHPNDWLNVITSDSSVKGEDGAIIGWNIPLDKLKSI